ncbi:uncharacterized protein CELE_Y2H9A.6 [Caenorhabditis elegans]|uniref:Transmembrane protein n=1 Tax=Caenorhabditis elegans TaxID=6239 RepID=B4E3X3_CAEEL|nr:Transmembrane protein [Caenorhabditis elegans]CAR31504.2 Transmembrane protein [Caenorhabditis elegans]|eukprot:NP_001129915.2 Uncharacterized protein CELE_Y2H9A.6 [Caenorhabditis elegans]
MEFSKTIYITFLLFLPVCGTFEHEKTSEEHFQLISKKTLNRFDKHPFFFVFHCEPLEHKLCTFFSRDKYGYVTYFNTVILLIFALVIYAHLRFKFIRNIYRPIYQLPTISMCCIPIQNVFTWIRSIICCPWTNPKNVFTQNLEQKTVNITTSVRTNQDYSDKQPIISSQPNEFSFQSDLEELDRMKPQYNIKLHSGEIEELFEKSLQECFPVPSVSENIVPETLVENAESSSDLVEKPTDYSNDDVVQILSSDPVYSDEDSEDQRVKENHERNIEEQTRKHAEEMMEIKKKRHRTSLNN